MRDRYANKKMPPLFLAYLFTDVLLIIIINQYFGDTVYAGLQLTM